jgi:hypothetical protein
LAASTVDYGSKNTAIGAQALQIATSGSLNTVLGYGAGSAILDGEKHTLIGAYTGNSGGLDIRGSSNFVVLSDGDANIRQVIDSSGNVGIGTVTPTTKLDVNGGGAFTTATLSSNLTLNGGTANGVLFLNSSKVATSGSALTFDGTKFGVGGNPASTGLDTGVTQALIVSPNSNFGAAATLIADSVGRGLLVADQAKTTVGLIFVGDSTVKIGTNSNTPLAFLMNGSERMRLTSSGDLLVGTTTTTANGGVVQVSNGITFPATQVACSNANTLDDYEEGTVAGLTATPDSGTVTLDASSTIKYTKIGNRVFYNGFILVSSVSSPSGNIFFTGSFPSAGPTTAGSVASIANFNSYTGFELTIRVQNTQSVFYLQKTPAATGNLEAAASLLKAGSTFEFQIAVPV